MPKKKKVTTPKKDAFVELLVAQAPAIFSKRPRGTVTRSAAIALAEQLKKIK
jgi:hypothetical protein